MTSPVPRRVLGRTGLEVTVLGYGALELKDRPRGRRVTESQAHRILNEVLDRGINLIDTSVDYGMSEERIGRHVSHRREEFVLATKCGCVVGYEFTEDAPGPHDYRAENLLAGVEQSLRRMRTEYIDLLQVHGSATPEDLELHDVLNTLIGMRDSGKVRFIGFSGERNPVGLPEILSLGVFDVFQVPFSVTNQIYSDFITSAADSGIGVLARGVAAKGVPSGSVWSPGRVKETAESWNTLALEDQVGGMDPMEFVIRFAVSHPGVTSGLVGTINADHLRQNLEYVSRGPLGAQLYEATQRRFLTSSDPK